MAHTERDLPMKWVLIGIVVFTMPLAVLYYSIVGSVGVGVAMSVIMVVAGFLFCSVSAYMAGLVGSSNNPVSGITIATILFAALVLMAFLGKDSAIGPVAAVMIGAVVCCAACVAGDNLQDLKAGYLVGATPWRQQVMLAIGSISCAADHGAGAEHARAQLRHRPAHGGTSAVARSRAGQPHGVGGQGTVRRPPALEHDRDRRSHRRRGHHPRPDPEGARREIPRAGARRGDRHLSAARDHGADLPRRPAQLPRDAQLRQGTVGR